MKSCLVLYALVQLRFRDEIQMRSRSIEVYMTEGTKPVSGTYNIIQWQSESFFTLVKKANQQ